MVTPVAQFAKFARQHSVLQATTPIGGGGIPSVEQVALLKQVVTQAQVIIICCITASVSSAATPERPTQPAVALKSSCMAGSLRGHFELSSLSITRTMGTSRQFVKLSIQILPGLMTVVPMWRYLCLEHAYRISVSHLVTFVSCNYQSVKTAFDSIIGAPGWLVRAKVCDGLRVADQ